MGITRSSIIQISQDLNYSVEITNLSEEMLLNVELYCKENKSKLIEDFALEIWSSLPYLE